ncbi:MAG: tRNA pseudouridine(13) synthase TruD [Gemmataceae bacterium]|nr:tRNA pseudouridine(13) synthase TruD [Gemmataceae bacterium]
MKLRQKPQDFQVEEVTQAVPEPQGDYAFYRLDKTGWTTVDALAVVRRRWRLRHQQLSYGGLKDRHAVTRQYLTIFRGPPRDLTHAGFTLTYLGQRSTPYTSQAIVANRFTIVMRDMSWPVAEQARQLAETEVASLGVPNYFDDQRFGSRDASADFVARRMIQADWEGALWLALAAPYAYDRARDKQLKQLLRTHWGQWTKLRNQLPASHARSLVCYLCEHPDDYKGAVARLRPELRGLYVAAYQSWLWNRLLAAWLEEHWPADALLWLQCKHGRWPAPRSVPIERQSQWYQGTLPLPSARLKPRGDEWWWPLLERILQQEGLTLRQLKIPGLDRPFFARGERHIAMQVRQMHVSVAADELQPGQAKLVLQFELPRGCYATMVVKWLMAGVSTAETPGR